MAKQEKEQDVDTLKRRGRRRLVGAVALVLLAVIVLPMVFDPEPKRSGPPVSVRIPGEDEGAFKPKAPPKATPKPEPKVEQKTAEEKPAEEAKVAEKAPEPKAKPVEPKAAAKQPDAKAAQAERARAEAALADAAYIVPVGAFANAEGVVAKLSAAKLPYYTQDVPTASGIVTRVRAGPFPTRGEAEKALETLKGLGFKPGNVSTKAG
jgi:DedD protein